MKKTKITVTFEINDTEDTFKTTRNFIKNMEECEGAPGENTISRDCDGGSFGFNISEHKGESTKFAFSDFATFINKYSKFINKWEIVRTALDYYDINDIKAETEDVPEEKKEAENA